MMRFPEWRASGHQELLFGQMRGMKYGDEHLRALVRMHRMCRAMLNAMIGSACARWLIQAQIEWNDPYANMHLLETLLIGVNIFKSGNGITVEFWDIYNITTHTTYTQLRIYRSIFLIFFLISYQTSCFINQLPRLKVIFQLFAKHRVPLILIMFCFFFLVWLFCFHLYK